MSTKTLKKIVGLIVLLVLVGCMRSVTTSFGDAPDLKNWVSEVRARPAPPLEQLPVMQQFETFEYSAQGMRDPFSDAWVNPEGGNGLRPDPHRRKEPLEAFPLDTLKMVGTIGRGAGLVAVITAPDKFTYRVRRGMYIGQNDGRVTKVNEDRVELVELVSNGEGGWLERPAALSFDD
ncbi:pilus assembly protein PilP [Xylella fastidiosa]|uniref:pilus assembly protein PilP n=1 Tax=Xylella fastidiosa TaxID=2371 RepID=UPI0004DCECD1|nr:pilus assembly protein PilP [Xylella fastidiosa]KFA41294.1 pilus assembly protein PilP [Xylella fastidiosa]MDD0908592.1 pilus assembly protein PilP [Xylella fastidiosa subsp. multiplex]MDD0928570.1 pilus assembly protein PilP [Xylella fastidiosa subsp. multiplex]MDD0941683.1 pilus assembly protein PilP [Xylella fastidiosa subsp. multiplex]MDS9990030.1 pilus assembly protein PilP [Xylella fastidiosa]